MMDRKDIVSIRNMLIAGLMLMVFGAGWFLGVLDWIWSLICSVAGTVWSFLLVPAPLVFVLTGFLLGLVIAGRMRKRAITEEGENAPEDRPLREIILGDTRWTYLTAKGQLYVKKAYCVDCGMELVMHENPWHGRTLLVCEECDEPKLSRPGDREDMIGWAKRKIDLELRKRAELEAQTRAENDAKEDAGPETGNEAPSKEEAKSIESGG